MDKEKEINDAHKMLDRLGADGNSGAASLRERLNALLREFIKGKPLPTREQITYAHFGPKAMDDRPIMPNFPKDDPLMGKRR